jgi:hypothetical protein
VEEPISRAMGWEGAYMGPQKRHRSSKGRTGINDSQCNVLQVLRGGFAPRSPGKRRMRLSCGFRAVKYSPSMLLRDSHRLTQFKNGSPAFTFLISRHVHRLHVALVAPKSAPLTKAMGYFARRRGHI